MADRIKVSTEEMATCIAQYTAQKARLMEALQVCNQASQLLAQSWAGPSFVACAAKMAATYHNLFQSEQKISDAIAELQATVGIMENAESSVNSSVSALDVGSSPFA